MTTAYTDNIEFSWIEIKSAISYKGFIFSVLFLLLWCHFNYHWTCSCFALLKSLTRKKKKILIYFIMRSPQSSVKLQDSKRIFSTKHPIMSAFSLIKCPPYDLPQISSYFLVTHFLIWSLLLLVIISYAVVIFHWSSFIPLCVEAECVPDLSGIY